MGPVTAIRTCYQRYFNYQDRAPRAEYLWFALFSILASRVLTFILVSQPYLAFVIDFFMFWLPGLAVSARRLHDTNKANWYLLLLVPSFAWTIVGLLPPIMVPTAWATIIGFGSLGVAVGGALALFTLCCLKGTVGPNRYGQESSQEAAARSRIGKVRAERDARLERRYQSLGARVRGRLGRNS